MNDLIQISQTNINGTEVNSVNARELHETLESKQDFSTWIKKRLDEVGAVENEEYIRLHKKMEANNATMIEYIISLDLAKEFSMLERNEKGRQARRYFIECEKRLKSKQAPTTLKEALALALKQEEEKERLLTQIEKDKPKIAYANAIAGSINPIGIRDFISSLKSDKGLQVGERKAIKYLIDKKYIYRNKKGRLRAYAGHEKYFKLMPQLIPTPQGNKEVMSLKVTGEGQLLLGDKLIKNLQNRSKK